MSMSLEPVWQGVAVVAICWAANELRKRRRLPIDAWKRRKTEKAAAAAAAKATRRAAALASSQNAVAKRAKSDGHRVCLRVSGREPKVIEWSNGTTTYRYKDREAEIRAQIAGQVTPFNSYHGIVPRAVTDWTIDECNDWLAEHPPKTV